MKKESTPISLQYHKNTPFRLEQGVLYVSKENEMAIHLCACGCGRETITPLGGPDGWVFTEKEGRATLSPSIGNFKGQSPYHAHYFIRDGKIVWT